MRSSAIYGGILRDLLGHILDKLASLAHESCAFRYETHIKSCASGGSISFAQAADLVRFRRHLQGFP